jgi:hypothetical protein
MKRLGATIVDPAEIETAGKFDDTELEVLLYELKADLNKYLASLGPRAPARSLKDVIEFNERNAAREMPYFGQDLFVKAEAKGPLTSKEYLEALAKNQKLAGPEGIDAAMSKHKLDAMVAPTGGPPWPTDLVNGDHFTGGYSTPSAVAGYPHVTVPAGYVHGLRAGDEAPPPAALPADRGLEGAVMNYVVRVEGNSHYMDESERSTLGEFEDAESALAAAQRIVDDDLNSLYRAGMMAD